MSALIFSVPWASSTRPKQTSNYTFEKNQVLRKHPPSCVGSHTLFAWVTSSLYVCLRMRGWAGCVALVFVPGGVVCHHFNPLMWVPSCGVGSLRLTALWQSEWHWGHGASPQLCHLWAQLVNGLSVLWQRGVIGSQLYLGALGLRGAGVKGLQGHQANRQTHRFSFIAASRLSLSSETGEREEGMRWEESHLLSFIHCHGITVDVTPAHTGVYTNTLVLQKIGKGSQFTAGWGEMTGTAQHLPGAWI